MQRAPYDRGPYLPVNPAEITIPDTPPTPAERALAEAFDRDVQARVRASLAEANARDAARELARAKAAVAEAAARVAQLAEAIEIP